MVAVSRCARAIRTPITALASWRGGVTHDQRENDVSDDADPQGATAVAELCRSGKGYLITNRDQPAAVLLSMDDYEALMETMEILANPKAMKVLRAARAGKLKYKKLDLGDENFGL